MAVNPPRARGEAALAATFRGSVDEFEVEELPAHSAAETALARYQSSCEKQASILRTTRLLAVNGILFSNTVALRGVFNNVRESDENLALMRRHGPAGGER